MQMLYGFLIKWLIEMADKVKESLEHFFGISPIRDPLSLSAGESSKSSLVV